jgi:Flp pilus assembly protein TadD
VPQSNHLFHDELFAVPSESVRADQIFVLNEPMKRFLNSALGADRRKQSVQSGLVDALYRKGQLKIDYDASATRNAAEAFDARAGNCLSLVLMTAAFAKELGLQVRYQSAYLEETWSRNGDLLLRSGHVNLRLGPTLNDRANPNARTLMVDFLPADQLRNLRTREISEQTVIAMYMNNKAVEFLVDGQVDDAYAWAREAVRWDPAFIGAQNSLGVIYSQHGNVPQAAAVFAAILEREPTHTIAMANLADLHMRDGRVTEANELYRTLAKLDPEPPYYFFNQGLAAMNRQDFRTAREMFAREVARADYSAEFHFWLGLANFRLGDVGQASEHLNLAQKNSTSRTDRDLYSAKLAWLRSLNPQ